MCYIPKDFLNLTSLKSETYPQLKKRKLRSCLAIFECINLSIINDFSLTLPAKISLIMIPNITSDRAARPNRTCNVVPSSVFSSIPPVHHNLSQKWKQ